MTTIATDRGTFGLLDAGPPDGTPVVLLHPLSSGSEIWSPTSAEWVPRGHRVLAPDARGHGRSGWDGRPFSVEDMAADTAAVLDATGIRAAAVVGMSMGGCIAQVLARTRPDLVRALVLADSTADYGRDQLEVWEQRARQAETTADDERDGLLGFQTTRWFSDRFRAGCPDEVDRVARIFVRTPGPVHAAACRALGAFTGEADLAAIGCPTLVLVGDEDYATPPGMARTLRDGIPDAELTELAGVRHLSLIESREARDKALTHIERVSPESVG